MWVPLSNLIKKKEKKKNNKTKAYDQSSWTEGKTKVRESFFNFSLLNLLSSIHGVPTVGFRRVKHEKALRDKGYAWEPKTRDFTENSVKNLEKS